MSAGGKKILQDSKLRLVGYYRSYRIEHLKNKNIPKKLLSCWVEIQRIPRGRGREHQELVLYYAKRAFQRRVMEYANYQTRTTNAVTS